MQPFSGIDSSSNGDMAGADARNSGRQARPGAGNDVSYRAKPFSDLIDEDKHGLVRRKLVAGLLGGYRTVNNENDEEAISVGLHLGQIAIYFIVPAATAVSLVVVPDDQWTAMALGGALPLLINLIVMMVSRRLGTDRRTDEAESDVSCCSKEGFLFLFPPKSGLGEIFLAAVLTAVHGALMSYMFHPSTTGTSLTSSIPYFVIIGLSSFSLFGHHCPEIAIYRDNDAEVAWGSNHYQRSTYCSVLALIVLLMKQAGWSVGKYDETVINWVYISFIIVYFLQVFGMLSHPAVTLMWAMEQANVHLLGGTTRASDSRLIISFAVSCLFVGIPIWLLRSVNEAAARVALVALAFVYSHNFMFSVGIKKPFKKVNERLQALRTYADIVFASNSGNSRETEGGQSSISGCLHIVKSLALATCLAVLAILVDSQDDLQMMRTFVFVALGLAVIQMAVSMSSRHTIFRIIPCLHLQTGLSAIRTTTALLKILIILALSTAYLMLMA